ncbi:MAG: hypothetical protein HYV63_19250 [Candidatus Schekmanbacteria bacterium]|nr:hypothetical protein [Candidatus Schekmanbacteria bacterium]
MENSCDRYYADPEARWGWDSHEERFIFGFRIHALMAPIAGADLPVHRAIAAANAPDVLAGVEAMERLEKLRQNVLPEPHVRAGIFDKGCDATAFYRFLLELKATPVIPPSRHSMTPADAAGIPRDAQGTPLCAGALPMRRDGFDKTKGRLVYNCPIKRPTHAQGRPVLVTHRAECPLGALCEPESKMGPLPYLPILENPRLNPPMARDSELHKELFANRTVSNDSSRRPPTPGSSASDPTGESTAICWRCWDTRWSRTHGCG